MSENWITVVPLPTGFVPNPDQIERARKVFEEIAPDAYEFEVVEHQGIQLFDCGSNLETITCPNCSSEISFDWWGDAMTADLTKLLKNPASRWIRIRLHVADNTSLWIV